MGLDANVRNGGHSDVIKPNDPLYWFNDLNRSQQLNTPHLIISPNKISVVPTALNKLPVHTEIKYLYAERSISQSIERTRKIPSEVGEFDAACVTTEDKETNETKGFEMGRPIIGSITPENAYEKYVKEMGVITGSVKELHFSIGISSIPDAIKEIPPLNKVKRLELRCRLISISSIHDAGNRAMIEDPVDMNMWINNFLNKTGVYEEKDDDVKKYLDKHCDSVLVTGDIISEPPSGWRGGTTVKPEFTTEDFIQANALNHLFEYLANQSTGITLADPNPGNIKTCSINGNNGIV